ncbi:MAG: MATE family efflux transporter, partial [Tannerellaceae bacterium]
MIQFSTYKEHYRQTIRLGVPIMLGQLGIIIVGFADNIMVGQHSAIELAAASFVNNFFNLAFISGMGFAYGLTPIIGGLFAGKEYREAGETLRNSLLINFIVGVLLSICMLTLLLNIDLLKQPKELMPYIVPYYILQLISVVFAMLFNSFKQFSDGTTDTLTPMWIMLGANIVNIIGNYFLIYGHGGLPEMGLTGAGISTLFSRILTLVAFAFIFMRGKRYERFREGFLKGTINRLHMGKLVRMGLPVSFQMGVEAGSFSLSVIMMGWIGTAALAAHQIAGVVTTLGFMLYYGIAAAVAIRVSSYRGWGDWQNVRRASFAGLH